MKLGGHILVLLNALVSGITCLSVYRICCSLFHWPSPKQLGMLPLYYAVQVALLITFFIVWRKAGLWASKPIKFLVFTLIGGFVFLLVVVAGGLRVDRMKKTQGLALRPSVTWQV